MDDKVIIIAYLIFMTLFNISFYMFIDKMIKDQFKYVRTVTDELLKMALSLTNSVISRSDAYADECIDIEVPDDD